MADGTARGVARDAALRIGARAAGSLMLGGTLLILAKAMTVDDFGRFILVYTVGMAVSLVAGLGMPMRALRVNALDDPQAAAARLFVVHTVATLAVAALAAAGIAAAAVVGFGFSTVVLAGAVFAYSDAVQNYAQAHLAGLGAHGGASALGMVQRAVPLTAVAAALAWHVAVENALLIAFLTTAVLGVASPVRSAVAGRRRGRVVEPGAKRTGQPAGGERGRGFWLLSISGVLAQLQVPAFALFASATAVGWFALATRVTGPLTLFAAAASTVLIPELARRIGDPPEFDRIFRRYLGATGIYLAVVVLGAIPGAWLVIEVVGEKYAPARWMLAGLVVAAGLSSVSQSVSSAFLARGRPGRVTGAIVAGGSLTLVLLVLCAYTGAVDLVWAAPVVGQATVLAILLDGLRDRPLTARLAARADAVALAVAAVAAGTVLAVGAFSSPAGGTAAAGSSPVDVLTDPPAVRVLLVGDSMVEGSAVGGRGDANWTALVQSRLARHSPAACPVLLRVSGRGGSGFATPGKRGTTFPAEVDRLMTPDVSVLVLMAGNNDAAAARRSPAQYRALVERTVGAARAVAPGVSAVIVSPLRLPGVNRPPGAAASRGLLQEAAAAVGARFVDSEARAWFARGTGATVLGADGQHPTDLGHRMIADGMTPVLESAAAGGRCTR
ncbi:GDSL-type esterase/lipase family protein [Gordonia aichiensis]|uniref:GDSL-type esterase/lipase family protein n=3 Tax=Gordonia TaxID=2053 RepID=UPI003266864F